MHAYINKPKLRLPLNRCIILRAAFTQTIEIAKIYHQTLYLNLHIYILLQLHPNEREKWT